MSNNNQPIIPKADPNSGPDITWLTPGTHNVVIKDLRHHVDKAGNQMFNKNNDPGIVFEFADSNGKTHSSVFWIGEKTQFMLDRFCEKVGINNKDQDLSKEAILGHRLWLTLGYRYAKDPQGNFIINENGYRRKSIYEVGFDKFESVDKVPKYDGNSVEENDNTTTGAFYQEYTVNSYQPQPAPEPKEQGPKGQQNQTGQGQGQQTVKGW